MAVALRSPSLVTALMPVDNAPVNAALKSDFGKYVRGMQHIEAEKVTKQSDADKILQGYEEVRFSRALLCHALRDYRIDPYDRTSPCLSVNSS